MNSKFTTKEKAVNKATFLKSFFLFALFFFISQFTYAIVYTFNGGTNWATGANWTNGVPPNPLTTGNSIIINANCALNIGAATQTINNGASITINTGVTLTVNTGKTLSVDGTMNNAGTSTTAGTGSLAFTANGIYNHTQNGGTIPTATWNAASTCNVTGITNTVPAGLGQSFGNFTWNCASQSGSIGLNTAMSIQGDFTITSTAAQNLRLTDNGTSRTLAIAGDYVQTGGIFRLNNSTGVGTMNVTGNFSLSGTANLVIVSGNAASIVSVTGNVSITAGTLTMSEDAQPGTLNVAGDFTFTGGTITQTTSVGEIVFNKTGTQTYTSGGTLSGQINFTVNSGSILQMGTGASPAIISSGSTGTFDLNSGGTLGVTSTAGITTSGATGNIQLTGVRTYAAGSHIIYNGNANQAVGNGLTSTNKANITIDNPGNTVTLGTNTTMTGILTVRAGSTLDLSTFNLGSPTSTVLENGTTASTISGSGTLTLGGGVTVNNVSGSGTGASISCPVSLGATRTFTVADETTTATDLTLSGIVSGATFGVSKAGAGSLLLSNSNTFTGAVTITAGTLVANTLANSSTTSSLGTGGGTPAISIAAAGTLQYTGTGHSTNRAITLTGSGATIDASGSGTMTLTGNISGAFNLVLTGTGIGSESGVIGTTGGTLTKNGSGTWILSGNNTYTGATTISVGTLQLSGASERISNSSALTVNGTLDLNGFNETVASLAGSGTITSSAAGTLTFSQSGTTTTSFSGIIQNGSATSVGFSKSGTGTVTFSGANTYTGATTLSAGTVQLGAANVIPDSSPITFSSGTFSTGSASGFSETIGTINLSTTGTISLGTGSHTLTITNSSGVTWAGTTLTISGWTGTGVGSNITASAGKIMVGVGGLTAAQLLKVTFTGFAAGAAINGSGELIPSIPVFYSKSSSAPNTASNWNTKRDGSGTNAAAGDFTNGSVFVIQGTGNGGTTPHTMTTSATWSVSGANSAVVIENGGVLASTSAITLAAATTFQIDNGGTYKHQNSTAWATTIFQGTESFGNSSTVEINATNTTLPTNSSYGNLIINLTTDPGGVMSFGGNLTTINGSLTIQNTQSREVRLAANSAPTITVAQDLSISGATSSFTLTSGSGGPTLAVSGNFSMTAGTFSLSGGSGAGKLTLVGNYSHTGGTITETSTGSGTITFVGSGTQTFTSGGTLANTINYAISSGATVDFATSVISNGSGGTFNLNSGGKIITANNAGLTSSGATGTVQVTGTRTYNSGASYEFQGSNTGAFTLSTANTINGTGVLTFNRSAGVTIDQNFIATTLALTSGAVTTNALSITIASGGTYTGGSSTAYVNGILKRVFPSATSLVFPIGKTGNYRPLTFEYTALTGTSTVTVQQTESALTGALPANTNLNNSRTWDISQSGGSAFTYKVTLDGTGDNISGTVVMLKKESGVITSNAVTTPDYTNTTGFTTMSGTVNFTTGSTCTVSANAGTDQTDAATCGLTTVTLSGNSPTFGTGQWSIVSGSGGSFSGGSGNPTNSNSISPNFSGTAGTAYNLQWTISNGNCSANDQVLVTFNQNPTTANAGSDQTGLSTCGLTAVSLSGNSPSVGTGQWSIVSGTGGAFIGGSGNPSNSSLANPTFTGTAGSTYTLRWTITNSPCTSSTDDVVITFNEEPTVSNAGPDQTNAATCGITSVSLAANTPSVGTGSWSIISGSGGSFSGGSGNPSNSDIINPTFSGTAGNTYTLRWTISNSPCNASTDDVVITFNQSPTTADAGSDQTGISTCGLTTVTLAGNTPTIGTGQWTIISGSGGFFTGGAGNPSTSDLENTDFSGVAGSSYVLRWTISNLCGSSFDDVSITFNESPTTADAGPDQTDVLTCGLTSVVLAANTPVVGTGSWSVISGSGGSFSNASSETSTFTGTAGTSYVLRWTISNSPCTASTDDVNVTFNLEPTASNAGSNQSFCGGSFIVLSANTPVLGTGEWSILGGPSMNLSQFSNINDPNATFTEDGGLGAYTLAWTITNAPCESSSSVIVTAIAGPWIGGVSTDWFDAANWCGGVPTATTDVTITSGATFYPVITTGSIVVQSVTIDAGGSLTVDGGDIETGPVGNDGTLTIGVGGTLNLISNQVSGTGDVVIDGTLMTSKAAGFSGTSNTAIKNTITTLTLGTASTIDYTSGGSQTITDANYANLTNSGNGDRTLSASGTIGVSANFDPGTGDYTITSSTVEFNGTAPQTVPALAPDSKYNNLTINNSTGVSMVADLNLEDALTLSDGAFTTTGFNFTLLSSATKTARIAPITGGSVVGDVTMQRFVPGGNAGWSTIGMPVTGRTLADWDDDIITTGFNGSSTGTGTFVNIYSYDETVAGASDTAAAYIPASDITNSVDPTKGYFVFVADNATTVSDKLLDVAGPPLTGSQDLNVTYTNNVNSDEDGWNLVSNPYCSSIDWTSPDWTKTNMDDAIYIYDADNMQYTGYVNGVSFNGGNEIIGSSQGFLVHANASSPSLIAEETVKDASSPTFYKTSNTNLAAGLLRLKLDGLNGTYQDETVFRTKAGATADFDPAYDAYKLLSFDYGAPNISTRMNGKSYVVNSVEELTSNLDLDVKVIVNTPGSYTINFKGLSNFANVNCLTFEDKLLNTLVDLHVDSSYTFTSAIDTAAAYTRFVLHFGLDALTASLIPSATAITLPGNGTVNFTNTSTGASAYTWDFGDGSPVETSVSPSHNYTAAGVYMVTLTASNTAGCSGPQSSTVTITVDDVTSTSNQVAGEQISIVKDANELYANYNFKNVTEVSANVFNSIGEKVAATQQVKVQNKGRFKIEVNQLAKGIYTIELIANGKKFIKKVDL